MTLPLKEIEALLETATRGEWEEGFRNVEERSGSCIFSEDGDIIADCDCGLYCFEENTALISALKNHAPALLAAAKREEAMREALEDVLVLFKTLYGPHVEYKYESWDVNSKPIPTSKAIKDIEAVLTGTTPGQLEEENKRLRKLLEACSRVASGDRHVIRKYCSGADRRDHRVDEGGLDYGTPSGIRLNTVGIIVQLALSGEDQ